MLLSSTCPLCQSSKIDRYFKDSKREYFQCGRCALVFVPEHYFLSSAEEKAEYDLHENSAEDLGYRAFLGRLFIPMLAKLPTSECQGLDFGSGPGPTLSVMFEEAGYSVALYDPFYAHRPSVFNDQYDFITATEVVEHLHHPAKELDRLWRCLRPGGILGIMTKRVNDLSAFSSWHYKNDPTHICFFSEETFKWLEAKWGAKLEIIGKDVVMFTKSPPTFV